MPCVALQGKLQFSSDPLARSRLRCGPLVEHQKCHNVPVVSRKFLHCADLHLDSPLQDLLFFPEQAGQFRNATRQALVRLVDLAMEERVDFVLLAGDIYDTGLRSYDTALYFHRQMARLQEACIKVIVIYGNHDAISKLDKQVKLPGNVYVFPEGRAESRIDEELGVAIHGRSYLTRDTPPNFVDSFPQAVPDLLNIGLLHTSLLGQDGHDPYAPCTVDQLQAKDYNYWALGHIHARRVITENPWIVYPGCPQARQEREAGERTCEIVSFDESGILSAGPRKIEPIPWRWVEVSVSGCNTRDQVLEAVAAQLRAQSEMLTSEVVVISLQLKGATRAYSDLAGDSEKLRNELLACTQEITAPEIWLARIQFAVEPAMSLEDLENDVGPAGSVLREARSLLSGGGAAGLSGILDPLRKKLPEPQLVNDAEIAALLPEVQQLLADRLRRVEP